LAARYLGTNDPLHAILLKKTLIAAVARAYSPGGKVDTICILQGMQGALKSTFWSVLASKEFFTDDISSGSEKDEVMKLSQYWLLEYAEFETAYRKKEVSALKAFLSRQKDSIRLPYAKDVEDVYRPSIFVGTTNKTEFLHDPTGERRYWVIPVWVKKINKALLLRERDAIWAAARECYRSGHVA
jgi:predicted P-loop ATPase